MCIRDRAGSTSLYLVWTMALSTGAPLMSTSYTVGNTAPLSTPNPEVEMCIRDRILCGDLNVAHQEIDLKNAKSNRGNAGFTDEERAKMTELLEAGFVDSFRHLYPDKTGAYSWWSYMFHAREKNAGWRIDYFIVSRSIADKIGDSIIHPEIMGSDHCPVELDIF